MTLRTVMWASGAAQDGVLPIKGVPTTINADGASDPITIAAITTLMASVKVGAPTGSNPSINFYVDVLDAIGNWLQVLDLSGLTGAGFAYAAVGPSTPDPYVLTNQGRFRWIISGGSTWPSVRVALAGH